MSNSKFIFMKKAFSPYDLSNFYGAYLVHEQHLLTVIDCIWRHAPADCWQRSEAARIGSRMYVLKLAVGTWSDKHSSGHFALLQMSAPAEDG